MITIRSQLIASEADCMGYTTYVFKCLEPNTPFGHHYCMMTRLPNWDHRDIDIGEIGYVTYQEVEAGKDTWYCRETGQQIPYNYTNTYFVKFVSEKNKDNSKEIIL